MILALKNNDISTNIDIDIEKYDMREWWVAPKPQHPAAEAYRSINNIYINFDIFFSTLIFINFMYTFIYFLRWYWYSFYINIDIFYIDIDVHLENYGTLQPQHPGESPPIHQQDFQ